MRKHSSCCNILTAVGGLLSSMTAWVSVTTDSSKHWCEEACEHLWVRAERQHVHFQGKGHITSSAALKISVTLHMVWGFARNLGTDMVLKILSVPLRDWLHNSDKCQAPFSAFSGLNVSVQSQSFFLYFSCKLIVSSKEITCYQSKKSHFTHENIISIFYLPNFFLFYGFRISPVWGKKI